MSNFTGSDFLDTPPVAFQGRGWSFPTVFGAADGRTTRHLLLANKED